MLKSLIYRYLSKYIGSGSHQNEARHAIAVQHFTVWFVARLQEARQVVYQDRFTQDAEADLLRLYEFILTKDNTDWSRASRALEAIKKGIRILKLSPFSYQKASQGSPFLRKLLIPFDAYGYVALFEIDDDQTVTTLAVRHQLEEDFH